MVSVNARLNYTGLRFAKPRELTLARTSASLVPCPDDDDVRDTFRACCRSSMAPPAVPADWAPLPNQENGMVYQSFVG